MSKLLTAICLIKETFETYAKGDGDQATLSKKELTELIKKELLGDNAPTTEVEEFFSMLDQDGDGVVDYMEYVTFVASFCMVLQGE